MAWHGLTLITLYTERGESISVVDRPYYYIATPPPTYSYYTIYIYMYSIYIRIYICILFRRKNHLVLKQKKKRKYEKKNAMAPALDERDVNSILVRCFFCVCQLEKSSLGIIFAAIFSCTLLLGYLHSTCTPTLEAFMPQWLVEGKGAA